MQALQRSDIGHLRLDTYGKISFDGISYQVSTYIEANSERERAVQIVPMNAAEQILAQALCNFVVCLLIAPYTSETGPPEMSPVAMVLHKASHVAINETHVANMDTAEKFFCVHRQQMFEVAILYRFAHLERRLGPPILIFNVRDESDICRGVQFEGCQFDGL